MIREKMHCRSTFFSVASNKTQSLSIGAFLLLFLVNRIENLISNLVC